MRWTAVRMPIAWRWQNILKWKRNVRNRKSFQKFWICLLIDHRVFCVQRNSILVHCLLYWVAFRFKVCVEFWSPTDSLNSSKKLSTETAQNFKISPINVFNHLSMAGHIIHKIHMKHSRLSVQTDRIARIFSFANNYYYFFPTKSAFAVIVFAHKRVNFIIHGGQIEEL